MTGTDRVGTAENGTVFGNRSNEMSLETGAHQESMDGENEKFGTGRNGIRVGNMRLEPDMCKSEYQINTWDTSIVERQIETGTQQESMDMNDEMFGTDRNRISVGKMRMKPDMSKSE